MKLLFSESKPDYGHYIFPYAIWAFPEPGETPADLFNYGFLPSSRDLDRFYLCRQVRVRLKKFHPSSENRRIARKGEGLRIELVPRAEFDYTAVRRDFFKTGSGMAAALLAMNPPTPPISPRPSASNTRSTSAT